MPAVVSPVVIQPSSCQRTRSASAAGVSGVVEPPATCKPLTVLGLGFDHHARAREPALVEPREQPVGEPLGRERGDVDARGGRIELGLLDEIGRRRDERRGGPASMPRDELVEHATFGAEAGQHRVGRERGDVAERRCNPSRTSRLASSSSPNTATGHGARNAGRRARGHHDRAPGREPAR